MTGRAAGPKGPVPFMNPMEKPVSAAPDQVTVTLPDGKAMTFTRGVTGAEIAQATAKYDYLLQRAVLDYQRGLR